MGSLRKTSSQRRLSMLRRPSAERETLLPCPACEGEKRKLEEHEDGTYKMQQCKWCEGHGYVDHKVFSAFKRWLRIYNHNRLMGRCKKRMVQK